MAERDDGFARIDAEGLTQGMDDQAAMTDTRPISKAAASARAMILPLALAQFIASYAATNMNVAISAIAEDLGTTVTGIQTTITLFTLTMAALMIPGSKLTDIRGRERCFIAGRPSTVSAHCSQRSRTDCPCSSWATRSWRASGRR